MAARNHVDEPDEQPAEPVEPAVVIPETAHPAVVDPVEEATKAKTIDELRAASVAQVTDHY